MSTRVDSLASFVEGLISGSIDVIDLTQPLSERTPMIQLPPPFANTPNWKTHEISSYEEKGPDGHPPPPTPPTGRHTRSAATTRRDPPGTGTGSKAASTPAPISTPPSTG